MIVLHCACEHERSPSGDSCRTKCSSHVPSGLHEGYYDFKHLIEKGGRGLEMEIEAEYIVGGMAFDVRPYFNLHILNYRK